jgi:coiled-coil domain-containing protein 130
MSALQAVQADGFYNPPDWDPTKIGRDQFQRSKGKNQYEQKGLIRFELMYNCWCLGCNRAIGRGTRYNARKLRPTSGPQKYFSTQIWEFRMKCATCPQEFVIRTDPEHRDYAFVGGLRRIESTPTAAQAETPELKDDATAERLESDALFRLEHGEADKRRAAAAKTVEARLRVISDRNHRDDYDVNKLLRARARVGRKAAKALEAEGRQKGFNFALLPAAAATVGGSGDGGADELASVRFKSRTTFMAGAAADATDLVATPLLTAAAVGAAVAAAPAAAGKSSCVVLAAAAAPGRKRDSDGARRVSTADRSSAIVSSLSISTSGSGGGAAAAAAAGPVTKKIVVTAARDAAAELEKRRRFEIRAGSIFGSASAAQTTAAQLALLHAKRRRLGIKSTALRLNARGKSDGSSSSSSSSS